MANPPNLNYCKIVGNFKAFIADNADSDDLPDFVPMSGTGQIWPNVVTANGYTAAYQNPAVYGLTSEGRMSVQTQAAGQDQMGIRLDFPGGEFNRVVIMSGGRAPGRHVIAAAVTDGITAVYTCVDGQGDAWATGLNGGSGWNNNYISIPAAQSETAGIRVFVFNAYHDRATRVAMSRYLGNKYGAYVA